MVMSIIHRLTGVALYLGTLLLAWWLIAIAQGPKYFDYVSTILGSMPGKIVLFGYTWALIHHMLGGIRHLVWDTGRGFNLGTVNVMSWATIVGSITITLALWTVAYGLKGMF
jgi:succinate dehydrogenase / fumarate reductase, cytochrome b subunit